MERFWCFLETLFFGETLAQSAERRWRAFDEEQRRKDREWREHLSRC
ncbi:hypothetical protein [Medusavirus stheno T3]|uniref:Uncharacterized protein n=1 Tax=Medusavirus stheno T3 TaxID=3069717 RepID=A0A7S7YF14_9VIRU|nr:hypothetical protein QKU73_gp167 [Acanthamoeba castellanii medusavirus]QPB44608.1 hypothetical protein [Medusavirus stheno T3]